MDGQGVPFVELRFLLKAHLCWPLFSLLVPLPIQLSSYVIVLF
ncbi:hypothetical protein LINGRAPRIM_LOCUS435 [Linum grandiflorum]